MRKIKVRKVFKFIGIVLLSIIGLLIAVILAIRIPAVQQKLVGMATNYLSTKTDGVFRIEKLYLGFTGSLEIEGLYAETPVGDSLAYLGEASIRFNVMPLIKGEVSIGNVEINNLIANILVDANGNANYDYIINAFSAKVSKDSISVDLESESVDSTSKPLNLQIGKVSLQNIRLRYADSTGGIDVQVFLNSLAINPKNLDLENGVFDLGKIDINGLDTQLVLFEPTQPSPEPDSTSSPLKLLFDELKFEQLVFNFNDLVSNSEMALNLGTASIKELMFDIISQEVQLNTIDASNWKVMLNFPSEATDVEVEIPVASADEPSLDWTVSVNKIDLAAFDLNYNYNPKTAKKGTINPTELSVSNLNLSASKLKQKGIATDLFLGNLSFQEASGFELDELSGEISLSETQLTVQKLVFNSPNSKLLADINLEYSSLENIAEDPANSKLKITVPASVIGMKDIAYFMDDSTKRAFPEVFKAKVNLETALNGTLAALTSSKTKIKIGEAININTRFSLSNMLNTPKLVYMANVEQFSANSQEVFKLIGNAYRPDGMDMPVLLQLKGTASGTLSAHKGDLKMTSNLGNVKVDYALAEQEVFRVNMEARNLMPGAVMNMPELGKTSFDLVANGDGFDPTSATMNANLDIKSLDYNNYVYENISFDAKLANGAGNFSLNSLDSLLRLKTTGDIAFANDSSLSLNAAIDVDAVNLTKLNLVDFDWAFTTHGQVMLEMNGPAEMNADFKLNNTKFDGVGGIYRLKVLDAQYATSDSTTSGALLADFVEIKFSSDLNVENVQKLALQNLSGYFVSDVQIDSLDKVFGKIDLEGKVTQSPILTEVLLPDLADFADITLDLHLNSADEMIDFSLLAPQISYADIGLNNIVFTAKGNGEKLDYDFKIDSVTTGTLAILQPNLVGHFEQGVLETTISIKDSAGVIPVQLALAITPADAGTTISLIQDQLILNYDKWSVPANNSLFVSKEAIKVDNFSFQNNRQNFSIDLLQENSPNEHLNVQLNNIPLVDFSKVILNDSTGLAGNLSLSAELYDIFGELKIVAGLTIDDLFFNNALIGNVNAKVTQPAATDYDVNFTVLGENDLKLAGLVQVLPEEIRFDQHLDIRRLNMQTIEALSFGSLRNSSGYLTADLVIEGTTEAPSLAGRFGFPEAGLTPDLLGVPFTLKNQFIYFDDEGIRFDKFSFKDSTGNAATLDGRINTTNFSDFGFNLSFDTKGFTLLDTKEGDDPLYFGKLNLDINAKVTGNMDLPVVRVSARLNKGTNLTLIVPDFDVDVIEREGVVEFVDSASMALKEQEPLPNLTETSFKGMNLFATLEADPNTRFKVIIDPITGDFLDIKGSASLGINMNSTGNLTMTGRYDITDGAYQLTLYELIKRRFVIEPGSSIIWKGDPLEAELDLKAIYTVRASALDLVADQLAGMDEASRNQYRQELDFKVGLSLTGSLMKPNIRFGLDLPEQQKGVLGGSVYAKLLQINDQDNEVNKQAFALLVLGRFIADVPTAASGGGGENLARSSASSIISQQLNKLAGELIKGVDLNFNVDSYQDYSTGVEQGRTELNLDVKRTLFNDRLVVQVGSNVDLEGDAARTQNGAADIAGDIIIEYLITPDGKYRLKGFRKNSFEGLIDGQLITSGISFIFTKEYDEISELFAKPEPTSEDKSTKKEKKKRKKKEDEND